MVEFSFCFVNFLTPKKSHFNNISVIQTYTLLKTIMLNIYDIINKETHNGNDNFTAYSKLA